MADDADATRTQMQDLASGLPAIDTDSSALSGPVAALFHPLPVPSTPPLFGETLLLYKNNESWPRSLPILQLNSGPLSPSSLLDLTPGVADRDDVILEVLDNKPDDAMLQASRRLFMAAVQASRDVQKLCHIFDPTLEHSSLPQRVQLALRLILDEVNEEKSCATGSATNSCSFLSATQLLLAELDATLESIASPRQNSDANWRIRDLLTALRPQLGLPLSLVLHILVGPLNGVCLRNLVWHGYVGPAEVSQNWTCLLWLIVALGLAPHRSGAKLSTDSLADNDSQQGTLLDASIIPYDHAVEMLFAKSSAFVPKPMQPALFESLRLCRQQKEEAAPLWRALALLYVILERGLRTLYAKENKSVLACDPSLARTDKLHVTISTMLRSTVGGCDDGDNNSIIKDLSTDVPNGLLVYLGKEAVDALYDEFVWMGLPDASDDIEYEPLPCRNELVHGAISLADVSPKVVTRVLRMVLGIIALTASTSCNDTVLDPGTQRCFEWLMAYKSRRHPVCQLWQTFRTIYRGDWNSRVGIVDILLPVMITPKSKPAIAKNTDPLAYPVRIQYCPICSLPPEYCCYTVSAVECLEHRFGSAETVSLPDVMLLAQKLFERLTSKATIQSSLDADEVVLASELLSARQEIIETDIRITKQNERGEYWSLYDAQPIRRSSEETELCKLWAIREIVGLCGQISQQVYRRLLHLLSLAFCGETRVRAGRRKESLVSAVHQLVIILRAVEVMLLMSIQQYLADKSASIVISTFLSVFSNTLLNHLDNGRFRLCIALTAGLVGNRAQPITERLRERLPLADRAKFILNFDKYLACAVKGQYSGEHELITNMFVLGNTPQEHGSTHRVAWASLRRWQLMSNNL